jgi:glycerol uptake facilitator-like aquaporin
MLGQFIGAFLGAIIFWAVTSKTAIPISDAYDKYDIVKYGVN